MRRATAIWTAAGAILAASLLSLWWWSHFPWTRPGERDDARLVVLPFEYEGPPEKSHFAAGLTMELTQELGRRRGLAVVAQHTSGLFSSSPRSLREIADELDAEYAIEGAVVVGSSGDPAPADRLRVDLRLIRVSGDTILMSNSLERVLGDVFRLQREIADHVALELGAQVLADHNENLSASPLALDAYFRATTLLQSNGYSVEIARRAETLLEESVAEDPSFASAWAELGQLRSFIHFNYLSLRSAEMSAEEAIGRAKQLAPESPQVRVATAYYEYWVRRDLPSATKEFSKVLDLAPNNPAALEGLGFVLRRQGRIHEALDYLQQAFALDRSNAALASDIAETYRALRSYEESERWYAATMKLNPSMLHAVDERLENTLARRGCGDFSGLPRCAVEEARRLLEAVPPESPGLWEAGIRLAVFEMAADGQLEAFLRTFDGLAGRDLVPQARARLAWRKVMVLRQLGRENETQTLSRQSLAELEVESTVANRFAFRTGWSVLMALEGRRKELETLQEDMLKFARSDLFSGPRIYKWIAASHVILGEYDQAVDLLRELSRTDYQRCLASYELHADPVWAPLREAGMFTDIWHELRLRERRAQVDLPPWPEVGLRRSRDTN